VSGMRSDENKGSRGAWAEDRFPIGLGGERASA
jgi:hypothetical protein